MSTTENKSIHENQKIVNKILDFLIGFVGSLIVGNVGMILIVQFDTPERLWISVFTWVWRLVLAALAMFFFARKRLWISIGFAAAVLLQAFGI